MQRIVLIFDKKDNENSFKQRSVIQLFPTDKQETERMLRFMLYEE